MLQAHFACVSTHEGTFSSSFNLPRELAPKHLIRAVTKGEDWGYFLACYKHNPTGAYGVPCEVMFQVNKKKIKAKKWKVKTGLPITVGHRTLADQNLLVSDEIHVFGHHIRRFYIILRQGSSTKIYLNIKYIKFRPFFGDVRPKFCSVRPRWCLCRTYVLSREKILFAAL